MSSNSITNNIQEYQALGFQITSLHNLCVKLDIPCLSFVQLNRDGITKESTDAVRLRPIDMVVYVLYNI